MSSDSAMSNNILLLSLRCWNLLAAALFWQDFFLLLFLLLLLLLLLLLRGRGLCARFFIESREVLLPCRRTRLNLQ